MFHARSVLKSAALAGLLVSTSVVAARAWDAEEVAGRMKALLDNQGLELGWSAADKDGSSIALRGLTVKSSGGTEPAELGDVTLTDVSETDEAYTIGSIEVPPYSKSSDDGTAEARDLSFTGVTLPKEAEGADGGDASGQFIHYETARLGSFTATDKGGKEVFTLSDLHAEMAPEADDGTFAFTGAVEAFALDLDAVTDDAERKARIADLGYSQLTGHAELSGSWRPSDGHVKLDSDRLTIDKVGTLAVSFDLSGYTPQFMEALQQMRAQMQDEKDEGQNAAKGLAMLGLLQQLTLNGITIRFEDDGITEKMLKATAEKQGTDPQTLINGAAAMIPIKLAPIAGADFAASVADAVKTYLNDPQSIEVSAQPEKPQPFALIMGAAMSSPKSLPGQLGLKVKANEAAAE